MARTQSTFTTVRTEGALLPPSLLLRIVEGDRTLPGLRPEDYHLAPSDKINEMISRSWNRLVSAWASFQEALKALSEGDPATGVTRERWLAILFAELQYGPLDVVRSIVVNGRTFAISHRWRHSPIHLVGARVDLDRRTPGVAGAARSSPHGLVQEILNESDEMLWGMVSNGRLLRVLRDNATLTRYAYVEFDLETMMAGEVYPDFVMLWLLLHESRLEAQRPEECWLERWAHEAESQGTRALDQLRRGVETAINELGQGFLSHPRNEALRQALGRAEFGKQDYYRQLLRLVYRLLFLFVAEDRRLLLDPAANERARSRYQQWYSMARLRRLAERRRGSPHTDLYRALQFVMSAVGSDEGCPDLGLPPLGSFLWSSAAVANLEGAEISNSALLSAIHALAFTVEGKVRRMVDYRNLGSEELGSVYESLLELHPEMHAAAGTFTLKSVAGHERKTTGSYYTPTPLIVALLDSALDPVLAEAARRPQPEAAILSLRVVDPACGSGHFLIAAAHRIAARLARARTGDEEPSPDAIRTSLRDVIGRCIHGVDINEMAVELCKVSLWMEALEPGKPLSFLDHRIACGNSLLGTTPAMLRAGIPDDAFKPIEGDDKTVVTAWRARNKAERGGQLVLKIGAELADLQKPLAKRLAELDALDDREIRSIRRKEAIFSELTSSVEAAHAKLVADAWCAAFVSVKVPGRPSITQGVLWQIEEDPTTVPDEVFREVRQLDAEYRFLHWHLAFPDVFKVAEKATSGRTGWQGGFDVVLSNPPWERVKLQEKEWFAESAPGIAEAAGANRKRAIAGLESEDQALFDAYKEAVRHAEGVSHFLRNSGRYPLCGRGDVNTFSVFAELMTTILGPEGGAGMIVPTGIATDDTTKDFFASIVDEGQLVSLFDFENRKPQFVGVDNRTKFCLLTLTGSNRPKTDGAEFVFFAQDVPDLAEQDRRFTLNAEDFRLLNPNTRTCPVFRSRRDAEITKAIYRRVPVLVDQSRRDGNPWGVKLATMFHMTNDSPLFRTREQLENDGWTLRRSLFERDGRRYLPLYEGRMGHQFNHRFATQAFGNLRELALDELVQLDVVVQPEFWVDSASTAERLGRHETSCSTALLGFRRVARNTDERTVIACLFPWGAASYGWILSLGPPATDLLVLAALYNSFAFDYLLRNGLTQASIPQGTFEQVAIPTPAAIPRDFIAALRRNALELSYTSSDLMALARDSGYEGEPFRWDPSRRQELRAEIDAIAFVLYGIDQEEAAHILDSFPIVRRQDEALFGEYRTKRMVLERLRRLRSGSEPELVTGLAEGV